MDSPQPQVPAGKPVTISYFDQKKRQRVVYTWTPPAYDYPVWDD